MLGNVDANTGDPQTGIWRISELIIFTCRKFQIIDTEYFLTLDEIFNATGWDTDQFMMDVSEATLVMLSVIKNVCLEFVIARLD